MPTKLADTRTMTIDDARNVFADIARLEIDIAKRRAMAEKRIADLKAQFDAEISPQAAVRDGLAQRLTQFILANPALFKKPRSVQTDFGRFGRLTVSNIEIDDSDTMVAWALEQGYDDIVKTVRSPVRPAIAARIRAGETIPGARLVEVEEAFYAVDHVLYDVDSPASPQG